MNGVGLKCVPSYIWLCVYCNSRNANNIVSGIHTMRRFKTRMNSKQHYAIHGMSVDYWKLRGVHNDLRTSPAHFVAYTMTIRSYYLRFIRSKSRHIASTSWLFSYGQVFRQPETNTMRLNSASCTRSTATRETTSITSTRDSKMNQPPDTDHTRSSQKHGS